MDRRRSLGKAALGAGSRIAKAQRLMVEQKIDATFMEGATSCFYYTGMRWGQSERTFGVVIPANGAVAYVSPGFEESLAPELLNPAFGNEVRVWEEDESPFALIAGIVKARGITHHRIGLEERVRFFVAEGIRKAANGMEIVDATPVTAGCRMFKSKAEIALMQRANDVTIEGCKAGLKTLPAGAVLQRRTDDRDSRRVRHPARGRRPCRGRRPALLLEAERRDRPAIWLIDAEHPRPP